MDHFGMPMANGHMAHSGPPGPDYELIVRQQPKTAKVSVGKEKADRKPIDPPPIIQLKVSQQKDPQQHFLQSPLMFIICQQRPVKHTKNGTEFSEPGDVKDNSLVGSLVSSLFCVKDETNEPGAFFVFGDMSSRQKGWCVLEFTLYEMRDAWCTQLASVFSDPFEVTEQKYFPGMAESTHLTRALSDQGVRLRLRKDSRTMTTRKRNSNVARMAKHYHDRRNGKDSNEPEDEAVVRRGSSIGSQSNAYYDTNPSYAYDVPAKRVRLAEPLDSHQAFSHDYGSYPNNPRTVPEYTAADVSSSLYGTPLSAGQPAHSYQPYAPASLPPPIGPYQASRMSQPQLGLTTQFPPQMTPQSAGPSSATSTFSPGTRRSPGSAYQFQPQSAVFQSPSHNLSYLQVSTPVSQPTGLGMTGLGIGDVDKHAQAPGPHGAPGPEI